MGFKQELCTALLLLHLPNSRSTILCALESDQMYSPGDHLAIFPENDASLVSTILKRLNPDPGPDEPIVVEYRSDTGKEL